MSGFESPNFKKNVPNNQKPLREFNVGPDENFADQNSSQREMTDQEIEFAVREAKREKMAAANKIGAAAKTRIEILANIGRLTKDVDIGGVSFSLRTLKAKETREAALSTFSTVGTQLEASYEARKQQLVRSIFKIDGQEVAFVLGSDTLEDKLFFIEELEEVVVNKLYDEFVALKEESKIKYGINTVKEAEEVSEDLKG